MKWTNYTNEKVQIKKTATKIYIFDVPFDLNLDNANYARALMNNGIFEILIDPSVSLLKKRRCRDALAIQ